MQQHAFGFGNTVNAEVLGADEAEFPINPKRDIVVTWQEAQNTGKLSRSISIGSRLNPNYAHTIGNGFSAMIRHPCGESHF